MVCQSLAHPVHPLEIPCQNIYSLTCWLLVWFDSSPKKQRERCRTRRERIKPSAARESDIVLRCRDIFWHEYRIVFFFLRATCLSVLMCSVWGWIQLFLANKSSSSRFAVALSHPTLIPRAPRSAIFYHFLATPCVSQTLPQPASGFNVSKWNVLVSLMAWIPHTARDCDLMWWKEIFCTYVSKQCISGMDLPGGPRPPAEPGSGCVCSQLSLHFQTTADQLRWKTSMCHCAAAV